MNLQKLLQVSARRAHEKRSQPSASASYSRPSPSASYSRSRPSPTPTIYQITSTHHHPSKPTAIHTLDLNSVALPQSSSHPIHLQSSLSPECHDTELATQTSASLSVASSLPSTSSGNQALETSTWRIPIHWGEEERQTNHWNNRSPSLTLCLFLFSISSLESCLVNLEPSSSSLFISRLIGWWNQSLIRKKKEWLYIFLIAMLSFGWSSSKIEHTQKQPPPQNIMYILGFTFQWYVYLYIYLPFFIFIFFLIV